MRNFPDHPDIERTLRTGYPFEQKKEKETNEDDLYEENREREMFDEY